MSGCGAIDVYDEGNGSLLIAWPRFLGLMPDIFNLRADTNQITADTTQVTADAGILGGIALTPDSFNVYVNGVLNQNVLATSGFHADTTRITADTTQLTADAGVLGGVALITG